MCDWFLFYSNMKYYRKEYPREIKFLDTLGQVESEIIFINDPLGNTLTASYFSTLEDPYKMEYEYQYDVYQNWIQRKKIYKGKLTNITTRKVEYFLK